MMDRKIKQVHFQITRNCNLRCSFCGQWGKKGFFSDATGEEMKLEDWQRIISELMEYREKTHILPCITVWGGEPLVSPYFDIILTKLKQRGFGTEVITNGVLIDRHKNTIKTCVDALYISLDGIREVHDRIRGNGVFDKVKENIQSLNHKNITVMSVITPELIRVLPEFLEELEELNIKRLYLQDMIGLTSEEIQEYKVWMKDAFNINAKDIDSWKNDNLFQIENIETGMHSYEIVHKKHQKKNYCQSPFNHVHIAWNGNVLYCTDFYDFSAGNVRNNTLEELFLNEKSEKYRREIINNNCVTCNHCSWCNTEIK